MAWEAVKSGAMANVRRYLLGAEYHLDARDLEILVEECWKDVDVNEKFQDMCLLQKIYNDQARPEKLIKILLRHPKINLDVRGDELRDFKEYKNCTFLGLLFLDGNGKDGNNFDLIEMFTMDPRSKISINWRILRQSDFSFNKDILKLFIIRGGPGCLHIMNNILEIARDKFISYFFKDDLCPVLSEDEKDRGCRQEPSFGGGIPKKSKNSDPKTQNEIGSS